MSLLWLKFVVFLKDLYEQCKVAALYYGNFLFFRCDLALFWSYLFKNPFRISKNFLIQRGEEDIYAYGETPLTTMDEIARRCGIKSGDRVLELGCGRGRTCFWLNIILKCRVKGVDYIPAFIEKAEAIKEKLHLEGVEFECADMLNISFEGYDYIYLYGTCLEDEKIQDLIKKIPKGAKVITISYTLLEYGDQFELIDLFPVSFNWGSTEGYLQVKLPH